MNNNLMLGVTYEEKAQLIKSLQYITAQCVKQVEVIRDVSQRTASPQLLTI